MEQTEIAVSRMQAAGGKLDWSILWKLVDTTRSIPTLSNVLARDLLQDSN